MKTIILTGGKGFIGSHVLMTLLKTHPKHRIVVADSNTYAARPPLYMTEPKNLLIEQIDIRDQLAVHRLYSKYKPVVTVHMAAESHVCRSITGPKDFATTNIMGTFNLLEEHKASGAGRFLHVSTDEVYGEILKGHFNEQSPYQPRSPYAASKASSDLLVKCYFETYGIDTVTVNMSNNFGPNQHAEKLVPKTILSILAGEPVTVHGKGDHVRDWLYVGNAAIGIVNALWNGKDGESYCLGGGVEWTNLEMIYHIYNVIREEEPHIKLNKVHTKDRPTDDFRYALDSSKAEREICYAPCPEDFLNNLRLTVNWYKNAIIQRGGGELHGWRA